MTPEQNRLRASLGAHSQWANEPDRTARTATARAKFLSRFERGVDAAHPGLPADVRAKMIESARRAYFARLALASSRARARQGGGPDAA